MSTSQKNEPVLPSESELLASRQRKSEALAAAGFPPYPDADAMRPTTTSAALLAKYDGKTKEGLESLKGPEDTHRITGRVMARRMGFAPVRDRDGQVQLYVQKSDAELWKIFDQIDIGDFVGAEGTPMRTKTGDFALHVKKLVPLSKTTRPIPGQHFGLEDKETRYRQRYVDLIANPHVATTFRQRSKIVKGIRNFMDAKGFLEVETPMMHPIAGGAAARPFTTHHNALDMDLYMRIAPELYLKRLVVGGLDRVYEINRNFRNEGLSLQHNPEFTMLEFYVAYETYRDLMNWTEEMISGLAQDLHGKSSVEFHYDPNDREKVHALEFKAPWKRVTIHDSVAQATGASRADLDTLAGAVKVFQKTFAGNDDALHKLSSILKRHGNPQGEGPAANIAAGHVVYAIFEEKVEATLIQPTFVHDFPIAVSPLARSKDSDGTLADRFELFIAGREIANAFSELNDPRDQECRFKAQMDAKTGGDDEAMPYDADYVRALEYGLPPTAGEGIGIDRLVMLLTDSASIRDVILFPLMRPER